jgi:UDP-perosamine 4-acetyltransferase
MSDAAHPIVGYGAGGHAVSLIDALRSTGRFDVVGLVDDDPGREGETLLGTPIETNPGALKGFHVSGVTHAFVGIGGVVNRATRRTARDRLQALGFALPAIVHATAWVSPDAALGAGVQVLAQAVVNAGASIGDGAIVNTGAIVEHDCIVGSGAHLGPRAVVGGATRLGDDVHVGMGAVVIENVRVGAGAFIAAGAVVVGDVPEGARVQGVPAR